MASAVGSQIPLIAAAEGQAARVEECIILLITANPRSRGRRCLVSHATTDDCTTTPYTARYAACYRILPAGVSWRTSIRQYVQIRTPMQIELSSTALSALA